MFVGFSLHGSKTFKTETGFVDIREYKDVIVAAGAYAGQNRTVFAGTIKKYGKPPTKP